MKLKVRIDKPSHGWIPIALNYGDFTFEFEGSDVPNNCIDDLIGSILLVSEGGSSKAEFHLEPNWYIFEFVKKGETYQFKISEKINSTVSEIKTIEGSFSEILIPFCRGVQRMSSYEIEESDWPKLDEKRFKKLQKLLKENKRKTAEG